MYLGLTESDWLLLGSLRCVESPVEVRQDGVSVRGQGSNQSRALLTPCADTYEFCSNSLTWLPVPSPLRSDCRFRSQRRRRREKCFSVWVRSSNWEREERRPCGSFWDAVLSQMGLAGLREANAYVKNGSPPSRKGRIRIRAITQQMNTYTHTHTLTQGKRGQPHGNSTLFILF